MVAACAGVVAVVFGPWRHMRAGGAEAGPATWAAADAGVVALESQLEVLRFGTPAAEVAQVRGFDRVVLSRRQEPHAALRRQSEVVLRFAAPGPRMALLDLDAPPGADRPMRVLLNGHRVARFDVRPGRRRYAIPLPPERQEPGPNRLEFLFAEGDRGEARAFTLAVGPVSALVTSLENAPYAFSVWAEGRDLVQAGPSAVAWAVDAPANATLDFEPVREAGAEPRFRVEVEEPGGERRRLWRGGAGETARVPLGEAAGIRRVWLHVDAPLGTPTWGRWNDLRLRAPSGPVPAPDAGGESASEARPAPLLRPDANVLVIVLDAAGARHFGCYGASRPTTPEIDRIAAEGAVFERAYTPAVFTRSAMASAWTSQLPDEHHATVSYDEKLPTSIPTLAGIVSASGIATAAFVGNNMAGTAFGLDRGFADFRRASPRAEELTEAALAWLGSAGSARFFAYLHYREPHYPFDPRPPYDTIFGPDAPLPASVKTDSGWLDRVNDGSYRPRPEEVAHLERLYDGNLRLVDHEVGRVRRRLEALGLWERTVVILAADHGEAMYEHGFVGHNEQLYEESVRIPLVVRLPTGAGPRGRRVRMLTGLLDVAPTVADVFGVPRERRASFRGRSLLAVAGGAPEPASEPVLCRTVGDKPRYALVAERHKYQFNLRDGDETLHDLAADPGEHRDVAALDPVRAGYFRQRLFARLLALPGRAVAGTSGWQVSPQEAEELRALGYVQ
jgi:arylsulfatase A-like enzyme